MGRVLKEIRADGSSVTHVYDALGRLTTTSDALGSRTQSHDNLNRLKSTSSAFGTTGAWIYDAFDRVISSTDRNGVVTTNRYDASGRVVSRALVGGGTESWGYTTAVEGATSYTNAINQVTQYAYPAAGRKTNEVIVGVMTNRFLYDGAGQIVGLWDGNQSVATSGSGTNGTRWIYDVQGRLRHKVYANAVTNLTYSYDALNRLTNRWSQAMGNTEYRYDVSGNVTVVNYPSGTIDVTQAYDALNRLTNRVDAIGTTGYTFLDDAGYPIDVVNPAQFTPYQGLKHSDDLSDAWFIADMLRLGVLQWATDMTGRSVRSVRRVVDEGGKRHGPRHSRAMKAVCPSWPSCRPPSAAGTR